MPDTDSHINQIEHRRKIYLIAALGVLAAVVIAGVSTFVVIQTWQTAGDGLSINNSLPTGPNQTSPYSVRLYYIAETGLGLVEHELELSYSGGLLERARAIINKQLDEAPDPLVSPFPDGTTLQSFYLANDGVAFVDLSRAVTAEHSGGSLDELFTVYALVNALTVNIEAINAVQIIVGGSEVDTLAGHIDLRQPLTQNMNWIIDPNNLISEDDESDDLESNNNPDDPPLTRTRQRQ